MQKYMLKKLYAIKKEMTATYINEVRTPITKIEVPTLTVTQIKSKEKDGYSAIQVAFGDDKKNANRALSGHLKKIKKVPNFIKEVPSPENELKVGDTIELESLLSIGDVVNVQGVTKGKGFAGVIKRWGFARQPKTHGQSDRVRATGSIGIGTGVAHVFKGKKMPGRLGTKTHTVKNSLVTFIDPDSKEVWLTGALPGNSGGMLTLTITGHKDLPIQKESPKPEQELPKEPEIKEDTTPKEDKE